MNGDCRVFKFPRRSVDGKYLMRLIFKEKCRFQVSSAYIPGVMWPKGVFGILASSAGGQDETKSSSGK